MKSVRLMFMCCLALCLCFPAWGDAAKHALVIGNGNYEGVPLHTPVNDADAMYSVLRSLGFSVVRKTDLNHQQMENEIRAFGARLRGGDTALFYFSGHGAQVKGINYLIPVGASLASADEIKYKAVNAEMVLGKMEQSGSQLNLIILDACRNNPFKGFKSADQGLAPMVAPQGKETLIAYATAPGSVAGTGYESQSIYTKYLAAALKTPGLRIEDVFKRVRASVWKETSGEQQPWESTSLMKDYYLAGGTVIQDEPDRVMDQIPQERTEPRVSDTGNVWRDRITGMEFVRVPKGCFKMGSPSGEDGRYDDEGPVHEVCVDGFWMGKCEVTNAQYRKYKPGHNSKDYEGNSLNGDTQPAVLVSWEDAKAFAQWLSEKSGYEFRLPAEAEWEYACRAGTQTARFWGNDPDDACRYANAADQTAKRKWSGLTIHDCDDGYAVTAPVGSFKPNGFGLYDMLGNTWEWCEDIYDSDAYSKHQRNNPIYTCGGSRRVDRGGSWNYDPADVRCAVRLFYSPSYRTPQHWLPPSEDILAFGFLPFYLLPGVQGACPLRAAKNGL